MAQQQSFQQTIQAQQQSISRLEAQLGQIVEATMRREPGQLPSQLVANPRNHPLGFQPQMGLLPQPLQPAHPPLPPQNAQPLSKGSHMENVKAITTLRSGKTLEDPYKKTQGMAEGSVGQQEEIEEVEDDSTSIQVKNNDKGKAKDDENPVTYKPRAPFPIALEKGKERKRQHI